MRDQESHFIYHSCLQTAQNGLTAASHGGQLATIFGQAPPPWVPVVPGPVWSGTRSSPRCWASPCWRPPAGRCEPGRRRRSRTAACCSASPAGRSPRSCSPWSSQRGPDQGGPRGPTSWPSWSPHSRPRTWRREREGGEWGWGRQDLLSLGAVTR